MKSGKLLQWSPAYFFLGFGNFEFLKESLSFILGALSLKGVGAYELGPTMQKSTQNKQVLTMFFAVCPFASSN